MKITVRKLAEDYFKGNRNEAANAAGVSIDLFNNWVSEKREAILLADGNFVLESGRTKIFNLTNTKHKE